MPRFRPTRFLTQNDRCPSSARSSGPGANCCGEYVPKRIRDTARRTFSGNDQDGAAAGDEPTPPHEAEISGCAHFMLHPWSGCTPHGDTPVIAMAADTLYTIPTLPRSCWLFLQTRGPVAQLDRAFDYESKGRAFESLRVLQHRFLIDDRPCPDSSPLLAGRSGDRAGSSSPPEHHSSSKSSPRILETAKTSLSPRPHMFITRRWSEGRPPAIRAT